MKKNKKFVKLGVALLSTAVLSTVSQCYSIPFLENTNVVYADESTPIAITVEAVDARTHTSLGTFGSYTVSRDGSVTITAPEVEGYELTLGGGIFYENGDLLQSFTKVNDLTVNGSVFQESDTTGIVRFYYYKLESNTESLPYTVEWYLDGQYYDGYTGNIEPEELHDIWVANRGGSPIWSAFADVAENSPQNYKITYEKVAAGENYYRFDLVSKDKATVPYTIELVDQDGQVLQTIQQSGVEGSEVTFDFPIISGYRVGKTEGFESGTVGKNGSFRLVANKTVKVYYDKAPSIDSLIRPEQRVEYQKVFDTFHTTVLKAFDVYKRELGLDHIIRWVENPAKFDEIFESEDLSTLQLELILVEYLFDKPVGLVLTDQDIINAIGWTPDYWDYQISYHKEITQKLEKAMANIAASKAEPIIPVDQPITIKAVYTEEQIEPGQKVDLLKEIEYTIKPGESLVLEPLTFEGWISRVAQERKTVTYEEAKNRPNKEYYFYYIEEGTTPTEKPVETPAEKQVTSSEISFINLDGSTYWRGDWGDEAIVGTAIVEHEVGGELTIPATVVPAGYEITDIRFNALSTGVKELPHTWTYEKYKNYTSASMSVPDIDILVKPVSSPATPATPSAETPTVDTSVTPPAETPSVESPATPPSDNPSGSTDTPPSGNSNGSTATPPSDNPSGSTDTPPSGNSNGSTATPPSDNSKGSTVTAPKDKEKDSTSNSNISVGGDKQPTDNKKTEQLAVDTKEKAATSATDSKKEEKASSGTKTLPNTGQATSVSEMTGFMMLGLTGLAFTIKKRRRNG
ncbi:TPA: LPXTG cell wall anchor domain-containing protein [Streptococcus suis]|nr:LPXTG cell wall anchor domain-containing protein [Streptococcus suis]